MSIFVFISLLNKELFHTAVHTGATIWMMPLSSHLYEAISKTSRWLLCRIKKTLSFNSRSQDITQQQWGVFSSILLAQIQDACGE